MLKCAVKVKSLCFIKEDAMKTYVGEEVELRAFITSTLDGYEWSARRPNRFPPGERAPGIH